MKTPRFFLFGFLVLTLCGWPSLGVAQSLSLPIPDHPATGSFGPVTILYPETWTKKDAKLSKGVLFMHPQSLPLADGSFHLLLSISKGVKQGNNLAEYKAFIESVMKLQATQLNDLMQKSFSKEAADKDLVLRLKEVGKWSLETEKHGGIEVLRSSFIGLNNINGVDVPFHTYCIWHFTPEGVYTVGFTYPVSMEAECGPFADWAMKHVSISQ